MKTTTAMPAALLVECRSIQHQLVTHHAALLSEAGYIRDQCGSRMLESALLLVLLDRNRTHLDVQQRLRRYLLDSHPDTFLEAQAKAAALCDDSGRQQLEEYLRGFQHFTGERKYLLLNTLFAILGAVPLDTRTLSTDPATLRYGDQARWTDALLCAIKILHASSCGGAPDHADLAYLVQLLQEHQGRVWEGHLLVHLVALHALHASQMHSDVIRAGITALVQTMNPDGGIPFCTEQEIWGTALAGAAIAEAAGLSHPALAKMGRFITQTQQRDGGWGYTRTTTQTDVDDTCKCIAFLRILGPAAHRPHLHNARRYLERIADPDGGFPTYVKGHQPEVELTAEAIIALSPDWPHHTPTLNRSLDYILQAQHRDGSFDLSWTLSASAVILHVIDALDDAQRFTFPGQRRAARITQAINKATTFLETAQNPDGGWGHQPGHASDLLSTAQALPVINRHSRQPSSINRGLHYLIGQRRNDGTFASPPDQVGPRPIPYDFPELANTHTLIALTNVLATA
ncbi:prenyltransferase/squalene oxidase repeat-containing protein [Streptomyces sp. HD]|uniref:prenyltransferase/squalene oxidase repeat-containing protein n=1 Tax=Streptomyces sp. HD TaxID=3020892 RepID=UPI00232B01D8|nr:prenyltransferase/squalene oxidase repeat-containing protein [Streptomyces sp. HD]MDC0768704.1 prenyltransferase/squalene oxidase repeat-containing protein [Streptomyces sp. HD]